MPDNPPYKHVRLTLWGLVESAGFVACAATLMGFLGGLSWFLDLFSHFRVQYLLGLTCTASLLCLRRRWRSAGLHVAFLLANAAVIAPLYFGRPDPPLSSPTGRAMLINVNTRLGNPEQVLAAIREAQPDLLALQEVSDRWLAALAPLELDYPHRLADPRDDNFGIALFSRWPLSEASVVALGSADVPTLLATAETEAGPLRVITTHPVPPGDAWLSARRNEQLALLPAVVAKDRPTLLLGDLNVSPWSTHFRRLLDQSGLRDSARGFGVQPSWPVHLPPLLIPIDHALHSPDIAVLDRRIGQPVSSDHYPLVVDFFLLRPSARSPSTREH